MNIQAVIAQGPDIAHHYFSESRAEEVAIFNNGDMLIVRFNPDCQLGFDAAFFKRRPYQDPDDKRRMAAFLVKLFRNESQHHQEIEKSLKSEAVFSQPEFKLTIDGVRLDEQHLFRLSNIQISTDIDSQLFDSVMSYSWLPPTGE